MPSFIDTYVSHADKPTLESFASNFVNFVPARSGVAAQPSYTDENGNVIPAQLAKGDPTLFYTVIRATFDITPLVQAPFAVVDPVEGIKVVGMFA